MKKTVVINLCKYFLAFGLLSWVVWQNWGTPGSNGLGDVWQRHVVERQPINLHYFILGSIILTAGIILTLVRWYLLVRAVSLPITLWQALRLGMIGMFFNTCLPGSVGGDIIRAAVLAKGQKRRTLAVATVLMDRAIALWGLFWFVALLGSAFWFAGMLDGTGEGAGKLIVKIAVGTVAVTGLGWVALGFLPERRAERFADRLESVRRVGGSLAELWRAVWIYRAKPGSVAITLVLSWIGHVGFVLCFWCFAMTLWDGAPGNPLPTIVQHFLIVPIGLVVSAVPLFPGGVGIGEAAYGTLYTWFGSAASNGVLGSLVKRVTEWTIGLVGYIIYLRTRSHLASDFKSPAAWENSGPKSGFIPNTAANADEPAACS